MSAPIEPRDVTSVELSEKYLKAAYEQLEDVHTPDEAEDLLRRASLVAEATRIERLGEAQERLWAIVKLRAERRKGELLGPGGPTAGTGRGNKKSVTGGNAFTGAERKAANTARKVWSVPGDVFEMYVLTNTRPTRSGLFREFFPPRNGTKPKPEAAPEEELIRACLDGIRRKKTQAEIGRKLGMKHDSMPLTRAYAVAWDRHHHPRIGSWTGKTTTKRTRELEAMRNGDYVKLVDWQLRFSKMCALLEAVDLAGYGLDTVNMWKVADIYDDLITLGEWYDRTLSAVQGWLNDVSVREKIAKLRDTTGRTPEEAETALKLATRLERKLDRPEVTNLT
jgi:hypothetical protein